MIKKKAKSKTTTKKAAKKKGSPKSKKELHPAEVRNDIAILVEAEATNMVQAVIDEGKKGQLAPTKYLLEMAAIYPSTTDQNQVTTEEESLAKTLLRRLNLPEEPIKHDEDEGPKAETPLGKPSVKPAGEGESKAKEPGSHLEAEAESKDSVLA